MHRIFVSYTLRGNDLNYEMLDRFKSKLNLNPSIYTYIDILDNDSLNHQDRVVQELMKADIICLINSREVHNSMWVKKELDIARDCSIPIAQITVQQLNAYINNSYVFSAEEYSLIPCVHRSVKSPRPAKLSSGSA